VPKWLLPTLSEILVSQDPTWSLERDSSAPDGMNGDFRRPEARIVLRRARAEREWQGAIAALNYLLQQTTVVSPGEPSQKGVVISAPLPVLDSATLLENLSTWTLTSDALEHAAWMPFHLLPASSSLMVLPDPTTPSTLPLLPGDPLTREQFCLVRTAHLSLVMVLGENLAGEPAFLFSFLPEVVQQAWEALRPRILLMGNPQIYGLDSMIAEFPPVAPDYTTVMQFNRLLLEHLPEPVEEVRSDRPRRPTPEPVIPAPTHCVLPEPTSPDVELLQAIAHEVRTPLTTIRTLTRSLLNRTDLPPAVVKRLQSIDRECSEQIDRFGLFFRAVELETRESNKSRMPLTRTSLTEMFQASIPRWQQQAQQRQLTLEVVLPPQMPTVVSDPTMLDQALTSLIERFTRSLPTGSHIRVEVTPAGEQLKVQLQSQPEGKPENGHSGCASGKSHPMPQTKSVGQLLMFQPETGSLSLNLSVTKNLFQALGGKLIVRQRPREGEVMTVFLPLEMGSFPLEWGDRDVLEV